jgi:uncharacterized protein (DUF2235 family)
MSRNLVICCDGTNCEFGSHNTNVVRLIQCLDRTQPERQALFYDPGLGTLPEPGTATWIGKGFSKALGLAFGAGFGYNVCEAYDFLKDFWQPGDRVFLFGFSRGAYTVRVLAGMLHVLGLLPRGSDNLVPYVWRLFKSIRKEGAQKYWNLCDEFRWTFARPMAEGDPKRHFQVHFMGLWDTVSSIGWLWEPASFPFTATNPSVGTIRHAVSIDERRSFFRQNLFHPPEGQDLQEVWFAGVHGDVGGGYPEKDGGLWRYPFEWILEAAEGAGLLIDPQRRQEVVHRTEPIARAWVDPKHESLTPAWWPAELLPKLRTKPGSAMQWPTLGLGRRRHLKEGSLIHGSTLMRLRKGIAAPPNLSDPFVAKVHALSSLPEVLPYDSHEARIGHEPTQPEERPAADRSAR